MNNPLASSPCAAGDFDNETAPAKINLALHVRKRRSDGYHNLETAFAFAAGGDEVTVEADYRISLSITGPFGQGLEANADNLVLRAANMLADHVGVSTGAKLRLTKNLPIASGIGGGSADAAATLRMLNRFWDLHLPLSGLINIGKQLGADVPACILGKPCIGRGRGDDLSLIEDNDLAGTPMLLVNPLKPVSTGAIFEAWDKVDRGAMPLGSAGTILRDGRNDLQPMAVALCPEIGAILDVLTPLARDGLVRMSGSGATCFALFDDDAARNSAAQEIARIFQGYWTYKTHVS